MNILRYSIEKLDFRLVSTFGIYDLIKNKEFFYLIDPLLALINTNGDKNEGSYYSFIYRYDTHVTFEYMKLLILKCGGYFSSGYKMVDLTTTRTENVLHPEFSFISSVCTLPIHQNKSFLHHNYIEKGLSLRQISAQIMSSKTAIREALLRHNIPLRGRDACHKNPAYPRLGRKKINGKIAVHKKEQRTLETIIEMYKSGNGPYAIATFLNKMKVPTKQQGKKWYGETVRYILIREDIYKKL